MNKLILLLIVCASLTSFAGPALITDSLEIGCGWSDLVYEDLASRLTEKSASQFSLPAKGPESGRRLYFFSDRSWFLTFEFFNSESTSHDISCIVTHGPGETSERALNFVLDQYPSWRWGPKPPNWP